MDWTTILTTVSSVIVGGLITAYFSRRYYLKASEDLSQEASNLKELTVQLMRMMDDAGLIEVEWDKDDNPRRVIKMNVTFSTRSSMTAKPTVNFVVPEEDE